MLYRSFWRQEHTLAPLTLRRMVVLATFFPAYFFIEILNWLGFLLDKVLFTDFRNLEVKRPLFIVGYPRSGTTFLQRLIGKDKEHFSHMKMWELVFAPSIIQKKVLKFIGSMDQQVGSPLHKLVIAVEKVIFRKSRKFHKIGFFEAEEDEIILSHIFASAFLSFVFPFEEMERFSDFDRVLTREERKRVMRFYKECVQRHLYVFGKDKHFSSKNPAFSAKIQSIFENFPDAKIVCTVRTPLEAVPSALSWMTFCINLFNSGVERDASDRIREAIAHFYTYPLEKLREYPNENWAIESYLNIVGNPVQTVKKLYKHFGFELSDEYLEVLQEEAGKAKKYESKHEYSLEEFGLTEAKVVSDYEAIFKEFGFETKTDRTD